jgi:hypothetical protein
MTPKEIINVVQAFEEGKEIEFQPKNKSYPWETINESSWNFDYYDYRVKQKEKELYQYLLYNPKTKTYISSERFYENSFDLQSKLKSDWKIIQRLNHTKVIIKEE